MRSVCVILAVVSLLGVLFTGCDKNKDGAVTTTTLAGRNDMTTEPERTTEKSMKDRLDDAAETVSEKLSDAAETVSEKLSEAGSTLREGLTDLSEALTGDGDAAERP